MSRFIQLHLLTSYPPANMNRNDDGRPKTAKMGGYDRLRVSSQSLKRHWRTSELFSQAMENHLGIRTKCLGVEVYHDFIKAGIKESSALEWAKKIAKQFGKNKSDKKIPENELEIEQLVHIGPVEKNQLDQLVKRIIQDQSEPTNEELYLLHEQTEAVDIALFGRMLASTPKYNVEAACQVAHAITVHSVVVEDDYFTAVDDLNNGKDDSGAAHLGEASFAAGLFYAYLCIDKELLVENLNHNNELTNKTISALTETVVKVSPAGKQNSFAHQSYASYVMAEQGDQQPRSLSVSFLKPIDDIYGRNEIDFLANAIDALEKQKLNFDKVYGDCSDAHYVLNVNQAKSNLKELLNFVTH